jgi:hypothetical protein
MRAMLEGFPDPKPKDSLSRGTSRSARPYRRNPNNPRPPSFKRPNVGTPKTTEDNFPLNAPIAIATSAYTSSKRIVAAAEIGNTHTS